MEGEGLSNPELAVPVRFLIDECRNIGKIPNLGEYLATCRKYRISISVIFQNYSQIVEVYGREEANSILGNCDTMIFLGGSDSDTLKIVCERLGKETVRTLSFGSSRGRMGSVSVNKQEVGRELMSRIQVEQMSNTECLVFVRALRPFRVRKYRLERHPNYRYLAEADGRCGQKDSFFLEYDGEEMEAVRVKAVGEEGYVPPAVVDSARRRAREAERRRKAGREMEKGEPVAVPGACDETKTRGEFLRDLAERGCLAGEEGVERLRGVSLEELFLVDSFDPAYEFGE